MWSKDPSIKMLYVGHVVEHEHGCNFIHVHHQAKVVILACNKFNNCVVFKFRKDDLTNIVSCLS